MPRGRIHYTRPDGPRRPSRGFRRRGVGLTASERGRRVGRREADREHRRRQGVLMLRKCLMTAGAGALVAMAIGGASFASASSREGGGRSIVVIEKTTSQHFLDLGQAGPSPGDEFFFVGQFW